MSATAGISTEPHYTVQEVAGMWGLSRQMVTRIFEDQPGVLAVGRGETMRKRRYLTLRIPKSVMDRVHQDMSR